MDGFAPNDPLAGMFIDAAGTWALEAKLSVGEGALGPIAPSDQDFLRIEGFDFFGNRFGMGSVHNQVFRSLVEPRARLL
jgi:hypothetical protein